MASVVVDPDSVKAFATAKAFEAWLARHHARATEIWLRIAKKGSGIPSVTYAEALDVGLCWGWIDGLKKSYDDATFIQRFTPRGKKSVWSQINRDHVARLVAEGRMTPHGLRHVEAAKADGRWDRAYAPGRSMTTPDDLLKAIELSPEARATYAKLDRANLFAMAFRVGNLKTDAGRKAKIASFVAMLARGETLLPLKAPRAAAKGASNATGRPAAKGARRATPAKKSPASSR